MASNNSKIFYLLLAIIFLAAARPSSSIASSNASIDASIKNTPQTHSLRAFVSSVVSEDDTFKISELETESTELDAKYASQHFSLNAEAELAKPTVQNFPDRSLPRWSLNSVNTLPYGLSLNYELSRNLDVSSPEQEQSFGIGLNLWPNFLGTVDRTKADSADHLWQSQKSSHEAAKLESCMNARQDYGDVLNLAAKQQLAQTKSKQSEKVFSQLREKFRRKQIREIDYRGAEVDLANTQVELLSTKENKQTKLNQLKPLGKAHDIAIKISKNLETMNSDALKRFIKAELIEENVFSPELSIETHPELRASQEARLAYETQSKEASSNLAPRFDLAFSRSEGDITSLVPSQHSFGATLSWNFWSPGKNSAASRARIAALKASASHRLKTRKIQEKLLNLKTRITTLRESIAIYESQQGSAQKQLTLASNDLNYGRMNIESYLNFRNSYWNIEERIINTYLQLFTAQNEFLYLSANSKTICLE